MAEKYRLDPTYQRLESGEITLEEYILAWGGAGARRGNDGERFSFDMERLNQFLNVPEPPPGLTEEQKREWQKSVDAVMETSFSSKYQGGAANAREIQNALEYQQAALQQLQQNYAVLADPNASPGDKNTARLGNKRLAQSNMGDVNDPNSPLTSFRNDGSAGLSNLSDVSSKDVAGGFLELDTELDPTADQYQVADKLNAARGEYLRGARDINYGDAPQMESARADALGRRELGGDEQIGSEAVDMLYSRWDDPSYFEGIDKTGLDAMRGGIDYYGDLVRSGGRDAESEAYMHQKTQEAERLRRANVDAALANLDARGMGGSGAELQAHLQGAGQSMRSQFDAAMQAASMAQQRRDAAAEQQARIGEALRRVEFGEAVSIADAVDQMTQERATQEFERQSTNTQRAHDSAEASRRHQEQVLRDNAQREQAAREANLGVSADAFDAANRYKESAWDKAFDTRAGGIATDATTRERIATGNLGRQMGAYSGYAGQGNTATELLQKQQQIDAELEPPDFWETASTVGGHGADIGQAVYTWGASESGGEEKKK